MSLKVSNFLIRAEEMVIIPLDVKTLEEAKRIIRKHTRYVWGFKIGLEFIVQNGAKEIIEYIHEMRGQAFLDLKFNDISNTVRGASESAVDLKAEIFNVHASAGEKALKAAAAARIDSDSKVYAVTVLTSLDDSDSQEIFGAPSKEKVIQFAFSAKNAGLDGIICSPQEISLIREQKELDSLKLITPGIRPAWATANDQKRVMTPAEATLAGVNYMVIGRPILKPPKGITPTKARRMVIHEIATALARLELLKMTRDEILNLKPNDIDWRMSRDEFIHIAKALDIFWSYDYQAAEQGKPGMHALLKSGQHSDGFLNLKAMLEYENIRQIFARQIIMRLKDVFEVHGKPDYIAGVPDGATKLGQEISFILGIKNAKMEKVDNKIKLVTALNPDETILLIEDLCTKGTGFTEAVHAIDTDYPCAEIIPIDPVIVNRGGLLKFPTDIGYVHVNPVIELRINDFDSKECKLCKNGSIPIKPKAEPENWEMLINSQK